MIYKVNTGEEEEVFESIDEVIEYCIDDEWHTDDDYFHEWLDNNYDGVEINGVYYCAYDIVSQAEDSNWNDLLNIFCEEMNENDKNEARMQLEQADNGEVIYIQGYSVTVCDEDDNKQPYEDFEPETIEQLRERLKIQKELEVEEKEKLSQESMDLLQMIGG